jgi:uncharacterized lipoprotein YddW (UPF0748 family)
VVRTDLTTPQAVTRVVRQARANGLNTLFVQCRGRADAYYNGGLEPRAQSLARAAPDFDPLASVVAEGHAAGLKVHAWVNACYVWSDPKPPKDPAHLVQTHPDWLAVDRAGRRRRVGDPEVFLCPSNGPARAHTAEVCADLARRYELDGLQLDYIRYASAALCFCPGCLARFEANVRERVTPERFGAVKRGGRLDLVQAFPVQWSQFRREQVTGFVEIIRNSVKRERPGLVLSAAVIPWGNFPGDFTRSDAYNATGQDWYGWLRAGLVDAVCPMTYHPTLPGFMSWVKGVRRDLKQYPVWFGIGSYQYPASASAQRVEGVRSYGGKGWVLFSYSAVTQGGKNDAYLRALKARVLPPETASHAE